MNLVLRFMNCNWHWLVPGTAGRAPNLSCVALTPQFRASRHVIFLVMPEGDGWPRWVVKVPRLLEDSTSLDREAANLVAAQAARAGGFDSIPRVVAHERWGGVPLLVQTALKGRHLNPAVARQRPAACAEAMLAWLIQLHEATAEVAARNGWFERLAAPQFDRLERVFPACSQEIRLLEETRKLTRGLLDLPLPLVFEHGDLSAPNLLLREDGSAGVVDWELAEPRGLPAVDLFFFLAFLAFAVNRARKQEEYLAAFRDAFFGREAWARPYVTRYAEHLQLTRDVVPLLFLLCWSRYAACLLERVSERDGDSAEPVGEDTLTWWQSNRYFALWRYAVRHLNELNLVN